MTIAVAHPENHEIVAEIKSLRTAVGSPSSELATRTTSLETEQAKLLGGDFEYSADNTFTDNTAFDLFTVPVAQGSGVALEVVVAVFMSDGTDHQVITLPVHVKAVNKAGTITAVVTELIGDLVAASSGTLTLAVAAAEGADDVLDVSMTAVGSLTETVLKVSWKARVIYGGVAITAVNANA